MEQNMSDAQEGCGPGAAGEDSYETLAGAGQAAIKVQRSRFLATAAPASSLTVARRLVAELTGQHHDAHHVCFAWRGGHGSGLREVRHDAGEPSGTAGEPILGALRSAGLSDAVVIVVRHFGGVKLGTGGLARAYGEAATAALAVAARRTVCLGGELELVFPYAWQKTLTHLLSRHGGRTLDEKYAAEVRWRVWLPLAETEAFRREVRDATAGAVQTKAPAAKPEP
jgi:uncharacterized YigZ family protein